MHIIRTRDYRTNIANTVFQDIAAVAFRTDAGIVPFRTICGDAFAVFGFFVVLQSITAVTRRAAVLTPTFRTAGRTGIATLSGGPRHGGRHFTVAIANVFPGIVTLVVISVLARQSGGQADVFSRCVHAMLGF